MLGYSAVTSTRQTAEAAVLKTTRTSSTTRLSRHGRRPILNLAAALLLVCTLAHAEPVRIAVSGLGSVETENLLAHLGPIEESDAAHTARGQRLLRRTLDAALQPFGYYESGFTWRLEGNTLEIMVDPGPRVLFADPRIRVDGEAANLPEVQLMIRDSPFLPGAPLLHASYDKYRTELFLLCRRLGFFDARYVESQLRVDLGERRATALLHLDGGPRYRFGHLHVSGSEIRQKLLDSLVPFAEGDPFDNELVLQLDRNLRDTNYFTSIAVQVQVQPDARADVIVLLEDAERSRYEVGAGFSTDSDLRLRFNRITPLLNDRGHSMRIETELSEPQQTVEATYRIPRSNPLDDIYEITAGLKGKDVNDTKSTEATLNARRSLKFREHWGLSYGVGAEFERYTVGSAREKDVFYLLPGTSVSRRLLQAGIDPMHGNYYWASVDFSTHAIGSQADFVRLRGGAKWLFGLPDNNTTLLTRVDLGSILTSEFDDMPASLRFYTGGDRSIRGYDFESLSPRDENGKLIGAQHLAVGSIEISRRILPSWRLAAFVDAGSAFTDENDPFYQSAGVGVRWLSPIGQIRLDLATPVKDGENSGVKLHISMGPPL